MSVKIKDIQVTVPFPATLKPPYKHKYPFETSAETVVADAIAHYEIVTDGTTRYYLFYDGEEVSATVTLGSLLPPEAVHGNSGQHENQGTERLELGLRTETISG